MHLLMTYFLYYLEARTCGKTAGRLVKGAQKRKKPKKYVKIEF